MSIEIEHLVKVYGRQRAVDDINFSIGQGEIVGFLGPNGAGKSTTMKIATGFLPPTSGKAVIGGLDVTEQPMGVKKIIGYLPEHNPLYLDMYVHEYLRFIGHVYQLPVHQLKARVAEVVSLCGLTLEQNKIIGSLSKGYRQRVGLAQALLHSPRVLILDEPTSGLDPNQIFEIRKVIREISQNKTVIFSSHIMQEVQALCDRVIVINRGKIVADDRMEHLLHQQGRAVIVVSFKNQVSLDLLRQLPGVQEAVAEGNGFRLLGSPEADLRQELFRYAADHDNPLLSLTQEAHSMEDIFRSLTTPATA